MYALEDSCITEMPVSEARDLAALRAAGDDDHIPWQEVEADLGLA